MNWGEILWAGIVIGVPAWALAELEIRMERRRNMGWRDE